MAGCDFEGVAAWSGRLGATLYSFLAIESGRVAFRVKAAATARRADDLSRELEALEQETQSLIVDLDGLLRVPL